MTAYIILLWEEHSFCARWSSDEEGSRTLLLHSSRVKSISTSFTAKEQNLQAVFALCYLMASYCFILCTVFLPVWSKKIGLAFVAGDRGAPGIS